LAPKRATREFHQGAGELLAELLAKGGGTRREVQAGGYEEWTMGADGLIAPSLGHYDSADWDGQLGKAPPSHGIVRRTPQNWRTKPTDASSSVAGTMLVGPSNFAREEPAVARTPSGPVRLTSAPIP